MNRYFMNKLTSSERSFLRSQAHYLEPVVLIGKNGVSIGTIEAVNKALETRELIKIKFREYKDEKNSLSHQLAESTESHIVGMIGHTVILFRQSPDPDRRIICLPGIK